MKSRLLLVLISNLLLAQASFSAVDQDGNVGDHGAEKVSKTQLENFNYRVNAKDSVDQLRYMLFRAKVVKAIKHTRNWTNTYHRTLRGQINTYSDMDKMPAHVQGVIGTAQIGSLQSSRNNVVTEIAKLLPLGKAGIFVRYMNRDYPGATAADALKWMKRENVDVSLFNEEMDKEYLNIINKCQKCFKEVDRHISDHFKFKILDDHVKYSPATRHERNIENQRIKHGNLVAVFNNEISKYKDLFKSLNEDQSKLNKLSDYFGQVINSSNLKSSEKLALTKKLNEGNLEAVANKLDKLKAIKKSKYLEAKRLKDNYDSKMLSLSEGRLYAQVLGRVIGLEDPDSGHKVATVLTTIIDLAELTIKFNNPSQSGVNISTSLLTGNYIMAGLQLFSLFSSSGTDQTAEFYKNIMKAIQDLSKQIHELGVQMNDRFDVVDEKLRRIHMEMNALFKETHENQRIIIDQNSRILEKLSSYVRYDRKQYQNIQKAFQDVLTQDFINCKTDIELFNTGWSKQKYKECLREFYLYSTHLSKNPIFNSSLEDGIPQSKIMTLNYEKESALDNLAYLNEYSSQVFGKELVDDVTVNPIMFGYGLELYKELLASYLNEYGSALNSQEKANLDKVNQNFKAIASSLEGVKQNIESNDFEILEMALDQMESLTSNFRRKLYQFEKAYVEEKLGAGAIYDFNKGKTIEVDLTYDADSLTMNKCDVRLGKFDYGNTVFDHSAMNDVSIVLDQNMEIVKKVPEIWKKIQKLGHGKISFCYVIRDYRKKTLGGIYNYYKKHHEGKRYRSSGWKQVHRDLMSGNLYLHIYGQVTPTQKYVKSIMRRTFRDRELKSLLIKKLNQYKREFNDPTLKMKDVIGMPFNILRDGFMLDNKENVLQLANNSYFYKQCSQSLIDCSIDSSNPNRIKMDYYRESNQDRSRIYVKTETIEGNFNINFNPTRDFLTKNDRNKLYDESTQWKEIKGLYDGKTELVSASVKMKTAVLDINEFATYSHKEFENSYLSSLEQCLSAGSDSSCLSNSSQSLVSASDELRASLINVEETSHFLNSILNIGFYKEVLKSSEIYLSVNSNTGNISRDLISDYAAKRNRTLFNYSLQGDGQLDFLGQILKNKREVIKKIKSKMDERIFFFDAPILEVE